MADYRGSVGYLQLRANNAARQQALADATTNQIGQDTDVGGKALGVVQDEIGDARHQRDLSYARDTAWGTADRSQNGILQRLLLKSNMGPSEKDQALTAKYKAETAAIPTKIDQGERRLQIDAQHKQILQSAIAAGADAKMIASLSAWMASGAGEISNTGRPVYNDQPIAPPITIPPGSGPQAAASHQDPNITPAAQPAAPDAAKNPVTAVAPQANATAVNPPQQGGYNPPMGAAPDVSQLGARLDKTTRDKLMASNAAAQELAPVLADAIAKFKATKPEDFSGGSPGGSARGILGLISNKLSTGLDVAGQITGQVTPEDAQRRQDAVGAVQLFRSKFNQSVSGMTVTEAEDTRLKSALGQLGESIYTGNRDLQIKALEEMERVRGEIYTRNDTALKTGHLPKDFAFKGAPPSPQAAPQAAAPDLSKNPPTDNPDDFFDWLVAHGIDEKTATMRTKKQFGIQ